MGYEYDWQDVEISFAVQLHRVSWSTCNYMLGIEHAYLASCASKRGTRVAEPKVRHSVSYRKHRRRQLFEETMYLALTSVYFTSKDTRLFHHELSDA